MTITISVLVAEGIVLAADSRQAAMSPCGQLRVSSDNADKIFRLGPHLAASVCGQGFFYANSAESPRSIGALLSAAAGRLPGNNTVAEAALAIHRDLSKEIERHSDVTHVERCEVSFYVAGYDPEGEVGELYRCELPGEVTLERKTSDAGMVWSGQREIIDRLILGCDPRLFDFLSPLEDQPRLIDALQEQRHKLQLHLNFQTMALQDAVDLAVLLVQATIVLLRLADGTVGAPGQFPVCGGALDVALITRAEGFCWLQHKEPHVRFG
jgi:hypothetical protein